MMSSAIRSEGRRRRRSNLCLALADSNQWGEGALKPDSDDIRDSPALNVAAQLLLQGAVVRVTDPAAVENSRRLWPQLDYAETAEEAAERADAMLVLIEWKEYRELDPVAFGRVVKQKRVLDGRNALDREAWTAAGWAYRALGRRAG
jgi:UDPglucose 6-dehydrogenase